MHETLEKFGFPGTLLQETEHWCLLLRPAQVTLGSMVLVLRDSGTKSLGAISVDAAAEIPLLASAAEAAVKSMFGAEKVNYLALMMVDPHVHFHIIPRYSSAAIFEGQSFEDPSWPGPPNLSKAHDLSIAMTDMLIKEMCDRLSA